MNTKYSILVPAYNEQEVLKIFYDTATKQFDTLKEDYEIIFVNDGSKDNTYSILKELAEQDKRIKVINFSRNFGQQAAELAALQYATGEAIIIMDCDLQDPPEVALQMIEKWKEGYDVVHGKRKKRQSETAFKKLTAHVYYRFLRRITGMDIPTDTGEFKLYDRKVVEAILKLPEHNRYLRALATWVGFKQTSISFDRPNRSAGVTKWTLKKMIKLAEDGIIANSAYPLALALKCGIFLSFASLLTFIVFIILAIVGTSLSLVAWLFPTVGLLAGIILVMQGFSNLYIGRVYDEVKGRPNYIVSETINIE
ncbi:MAG: glycosyltransferase family 2 protein [Erysipelotrichales bacterium]|nr:glycosyltransferase family 2 protein [Erysipelotrichales bacterium]